MAIEQCVSINSRQLSKIGRLPEKISSVYIGSDACEHLMATSDDIDNILSLGKNPVMPLPVLTDFFLKRACDEIEKTLKFHNRLEVSANDIGTLAFLHRTFGKNISISVGRILTYLWSKNSVDFSREMAERFSIGYFETDEANTANSMINAGLKTALHYPYRFYGVTRTCYYTKETLESCPRQCGDVFVPLGDGQVLWRGNAYYTKEVRMPEKMPHRLILSYSLPC